jgi:hypothetical protein|tara:strand:- start:9619 stop:9852 length:234 start_codon:yes stop_codon:yes gene_type:complete
MATLIPTYTITEFKKLKARQLKELKSCEVYSDGEYLFTFVNSQTDFVKVNAERFALRSNTVGGKTIEEVMEAEVAVV